MLKTVLIDDEPAARAVTRSLLAEHFADRLAVVGEAAGVAEGQALLERARPDLVFLDIDMPDGTGFDLLERWPEVPPFGVIFVTAFGHFAIRAFRFAAFDFMVKPLSPSLFREGVARFIEKKQRVEAVQLEVARQLLGTERPPDRLLVPHAGGFEVVVLSELLCLESDGSYSTLFSKNRPPVVSSRHLADFEKMLPEPPFMRVHQSFVINLREVTGFESGDTADAVLTGGKRVPVARRRRAEFVEAVGRLALPG